MDRYQELLDLIATFKSDFDKFYLKKNKSAGVRLRKHMAVLKRKAQEIRNEVQEIKAKMAQETEPQGMGSTPSEQQIQQ
ncbi:MAG: histone H1 [Bacteroidetes bacterium]|nr:histone H1 [Bacteroidota bacterium]